MNLEEKLYTSTEVAEILGVSLRSVYRYLEESKLEAEVKTATGRHRFTKKNILDFLYPNGEKKDLNLDSTKQNVNAIDKSFKNNQNTQSTLGKNTPVENRKINGTQKNMTDQEIVSSKIEHVNPNASPTSNDSEQVDWLAKFREAANKFKTQEQEQQSTIQTKPPLEEDDFPFASETKEAFVDKYDVKKYYYRSGVGGLKDIAQNIDRSARKASVDYAFTMNSGLSLHKPIKPFSQLHVYVKSQDKELFERMLQLSPSDVSGAQLCLTISNRPNIYNDKQELHGLYVVSNMQLKNDLVEAGYEDLARELDTL